MFKPEGFSNLRRVGGGVYGEVYVANDTKQNGKKVAVKRMRYVVQPEDGAELDAVELAKRTCTTETAILKHLKGHDNILGIQRSEADYIVLDWMMHDLRGLLNSDHHDYFSHPQIKGYALQALKGLSWCHERGVIHRDVKPDNLLVSPENVVKLADFGMACFYDPNRKRPMKHGVCTMWYRAPELFLGTPRYGFEVDVWSMGVTLAELVADTPLFFVMDANREHAQVQAMWNMLGTPLENGWPEANALPLWDTFKPADGVAVTRNLRNTFQAFNKTSRAPWFTTGLLDLLDKMLAFNPKARISSAEALAHAYWNTEHPKPHTPSLLPKYSDSCFGSAIKKAK